MRILSHRCRYAYEDKDATLGCRKLSASLLFWQEGSNVAFLDLGLSRFDPEFRIFRFDDHPVAST